MSIFKFYDSYFLVLTVVFLYIQLQFLTDGFGVDTGGGVFLSVEEDVLI